MSYQPQLVSEPRISGLPSTESANKKIKPSKVPENIIEKNTGLFDKRIRRNHPGIKVAVSIVPLGSVGDFFHHPKQAGKIPLII